MSDEGFGVPFPKMFCWEEKSINSVDLSGGAQVRVERPVTHEVLAEFSGLLELI